MKILVDKRDKSLLAIGSEISYGVFDDPFNKWKVIDANGYITYYIGDLESFIVEDIQNDVKIFKNCYTETDGFYLNPSYTEPINAEEEVKKLIQENIDLKAQLDKVQEVLDFLVMQ